MPNISVAIAKNGKPYKQIKDQVEFLDSKLSGYVDVLRAIQKNVNSLLTEIVEEEKSNEMSLDENMEDDEDEDSDVEEMSNSIAKRKLVSLNNRKRFKRL